MNKSQKWYQDVWIELFQQSDQISSRSLENYETKWSQVLVRSDLVTRKQELKSLKVV